MSKNIHNTRKFQESNKENIFYRNNYSNKNIEHNKKYDKIIGSTSALTLNTNNQVIANNLFTTKENNNIHNHRISNNQKNNQDNKYISINDIIGEKCDLNLDILRFFFNNYEQSKTSKKKLGIIKSYGVNTYQGIVRNYNEDRVSIIINMNKPKNWHKKIWPKISFFGIYDGHGGEGCSEYLRDNLHKLICINNEYFPDNIPEAIKLGFQKAEKDFINNHALNGDNEIIDRSGSCAVIILIIDKKIYIANVGDSRCLLSMENGKKYIEVTKDHKPNSPNELKRIKRYGGNIYQTETTINNASNPNLEGKILIGPYRVVPGRLSVSRTIGDVEAKMVKFGGIPNVIIAEPEIFFYDLNRNDIDFFILGCDGIYDQMSSNEILDCVWMILKEKEHSSVKQIKDIHSQSGLIVDLIIKSALARKSFDNVTCLFVALKELGIQFTEQNNNEDKNDKNTKNNNKDNNESPNILPVTPLSISTNFRDKNNFEKLSLLTRKSNTSLDNSKYSYINNENNRRNNNFYLSDYRGTNRNDKKSLGFNTDFKIRNVKLNNTVINNTNINENNKSLSKYYINSRLSQGRLETNPNIHTFNRIESYKNNDENQNYNNRLRKSNNEILYNYRNTDSSIKKISEGNILNKKYFGMGKINEESSYLNTSSNNTYKPLSKYNNISSQIKINDSKNIRKNLSTTNNSFVSLNNDNNLNKNNNRLNTVTQRYLLSNPENKTSNYNSIRKNYLNLNHQFKLQNKIEGNNNSIPSVSTKNSNIIKEKYNFPINNVGNRNINNNTLLRSTDSNIFSERMKRNIRASNEQPLNNTSFRLSNQFRGVANSNSNNNIYNNNIQKNIRAKYNNEKDKDYTSYTHKNNNNKYSNISMTEINNSKGNIISKGNELNDKNNVGERRRYNIQQSKKNENNSNIDIKNYKFIRNTETNKDIKEVNNEGKNNNKISKYYYHRY